VNYLLPLGATIEDEADLDIEAISAADVLSQMETAGNALNLIILDACRNNPFKGRMRSSSRGLARIQAASGSLIAFAAGPGQVAADGRGANSPYTKALVTAMAIPGLAVEQVFKRARVMVEKDTGGAQTPWEESSLRGDFYFKPAKPGAVTPSQAPAPKPAVNEATQVWDRIKDTKDKAVLKAYIERFKDSFYATLAKSRLNALNRIKITILLNPKLAREYYKQGRAYWVKGQYDKAIADLTMAIKFDPKLVSAYAGRSFAYYKKKQYDKAIADSTTAIKLNPKHFSAYLNRSIAYTAKKQYNLSIADSTTAIKLNPKSAAGYNNRAWAYFK